MTAATAILMIDVQKTYLDQAGRDLLGWPPIWRLGEVVRECRQLLAAGRAAGISVIYTRAVQRPDGADVTPRMRRLLASSPATAHHRCPPQARTLRRSWTRSRPSPGTS
jgi:ureidoacrylate peracid hydrolase